MGSVTFFPSIYTSDAVVLSKLHMLFIPLGWAATIHQMTLQPSVSLRAPAPSKAQPQSIRIRWQPVPHAPPETGHCSPIMEQKQSSEAAHLLQGHSVKYDPSGADTSLSYWFFGCWQSALSEHLLLLLHCGLIQTLQKQRWKHVLVPSYLLHLRSPLHFLWAAEQLWPNDTLCSSLSETSV